MKPYLPLSDSFSPECVHGLYTCPKCNGDQARETASSASSVFETVMAAPTVTVEQKMVRLPGPRLLGFRGFSGDGANLKGVGVDHTWLPGGTEVATCSTGGRHSGSSVPSPTCSCGWHAYKDRKSLSGQIGPNYWIGAVTAFGKVVPHVDGFRAEKMRVVALLGPVDLLNGEAIAEAYGVPMFRYAPYVTADFDITDGATKIYFGANAYEKAFSALEKFATAFGTPLDILVDKSGALRTSAPAPKSTVANVIAGFGKTERQKLYNRKWADAKRVGRMVEFKAAWKAGLVNAAWTP